jgi:hypothetical protein
MGAEKLNSFALSSYDFGLRRDAHQLLAWGYQDALPHIQGNLMEEEITGQIVEAIEKRFDDPATPERFDRYSIDEEKPIAVEGRKGKTRRRLDLVVVSGLSRPRPKYIFEAKRLRKNGYPIGRYVGEDGLQCFVKGVYASKYPEAAMVGYIQSDTVSYWEAELNRSFDSDLHNNLHVKQLLQKAQIQSSIPDIWFSEHEREESSSIIVYHIFLNCYVSSE